MSVQAFGLALGSSPSPINYGSTPVNSGPYTYLTLTNRTRATIKISQVAVTGSFKFSGITTPLNLASFKSVTFMVKFVPKSVGNFTGTLTVSSNVPKVTVPLSGTGVSAGSTLTISPTSFSFGNVTVGNTSTQTVTLKAGTLPISISAATTTNPEFTLSGLTLPKTIAAGQSLTVGVNFKPTSSGSTSTQFSIADSAANSPGKITATGAGVSTKQHTVGLTWSPSTSSVVGYNIYRGTTTGGPYSRLNSGSLVSTSYSDSTVKSGSTYFYVTTALNSSGAESIKSNEVRAAVPTP